MGTLEISKNKRTNKTNFSKESLASASETDEESIEISPYEILSVFSLIEIWISKKVTVHKSSCFLRSEKIP